jgi:hypothetical protein
MRVKKKAEAVPSSMRPRAQPRVDSGTRNVAWMSPRSKARIELS